MKTGTEFPLDPAPLAAMEAALHVPRRPQPPATDLGRRLPWRARWRRLAGAGEWSRRTLLAGPLLAVAFAIFAFGGVYGWAYGCAYLLVFATLAAWSVRCWRGRQPAFWHPVYAALLACAGLVAAQLLLGTTAVAASTLAAALHLGVAGVAFFLVTQLYRGERDAGWITPSFAVLTGVLALLAILQMLTSTNGIYWTFTYTYASPAGSFVNRNNFSGCMELLLPMACVEAYRRRARGWLHLLPWAAAPALGIAALVLAASRGGLVALVVEALAALTLLLIGERRAHRPRKGGWVPGWWPPPRERSAQLSAAARRQRRLAATAAVIALTGALVWSVGMERMLARADATNLHAPNVEQRLDLNVSSGAMFRQRLLLGWGLGAWPNVYPAFARFTDTDVFEFAHNDYLQWLAETGVAGVGCAALFWGFWVVALRRRLRLATGEEAAVSAAAVIAIVGIAAHSWVDFNLHIPANLLLFFILAGLAIGGPPTRFYRPVE